MSALPVVTRLAPSPTGALHLGNARTALFSYLFARQAGGRFLLRIEDTDTARSTAAHAQAALADLAWLGLSWDGPVLQQSRRRAVYDAALDRLGQRGATYPCYCSPAQLAQDRAALLAAGKPPRYVGRCRDLPATERIRRITRGEPFAIRFRVPQDETVAFDDVVHGPLTFRGADIGDFVLRRADGTPAFFFSNAIDDADSGVTLVLRGEDHLTNTPRQLLLLAKLGLPAPRYGHLPLLLGESGKPLSKREGAASLREFHARGFLPVALNNLMFRLGHFTPLSDLLSLPQMISSFEPSRLQKAAAHVDPGQLLGWQKVAAHSLSIAERAAWIGAAIPEAHRAALLPVLANNLVLPEEARAWSTILLGPPPELDDAARAAVDAAPTALFAAAANAAGRGAALREIAGVAAEATGLRGPAIYKPLRAALTGRLEGPDLGALLPLLSPQSLRERLQRFA